MASHSGTVQDEEPAAGSTPTEIESALETARRQLQHAADHLAIDPNIVARLEHPKKVFDVEGRRDVGKPVSSLVLVAADHAVSHLTKS